ncbi:MAG: MFS transporter [bacterium]
MTVKFASVAFRALRHRNYAFFFAGQGLSMVGYWVQQVAAGWLMYELTQSAFALGLLAFFSNLPVLLLSPLAGWWSDHADRRRLMLASQVLEGIQALVLVVLTVTGLIQPWHLMVLGSILGALVALELAVRQTFLLDLIDVREDLPSAISLTATMGQAGRLIGPAIAGALLVAVGPAWCFAVNALSYVAVVGSILAIRTRPQPPSATRGSFIAGLSEGFAYAWNSYPIRNLLISLALVSVLVTPYQNLMPAFVAQVYAGDPRMLGILLALAGGGALAGSLYLAARPNAAGLLNVLNAAMAAAGLGLLAFAFSDRWWQSAPLVVLVGLGVLATTLPGQLIMQTPVDDDKRGRVMSLSTMLFMGVGPIGNLLAGSVAEAIGPRLALALNGALCAAAAVWLFALRGRMRAAMRPTVERLGIRSP